MRTFAAAPGWRLCRTCAAPLPYVSAILDAIFSPIAVMNVYFLESFYLRRTFAAPLPHLWFQKWSNFRLLRGNFRGPPSSRLWRDEKDTDKEKDTIFYAADERRVGGVAVSDCPSPVYTPAQPACWDRAGWVGGVGWGGW